MPKKLFATTIILLLAITSLSLVSSVTANFIPTQPEIRINTPKQAKTIIYQNTSVPLLVDVKETASSQPPHHYPEIDHIYYQLNVQPKEIWKVALPDTQAYEQMENAQQS